MNMLDRLCSSWFRKVPNDDIITTNMQSHIYVLISRIAISSDANNGIQSVPAGLVTRKCYQPLFAHFICHNEGNS